MSDSDLAFNGQPGNQRVPKPLSIYMAVDEWGISRKGGPAERLELTCCFWPL